LPPLRLLTEDRQSNVWFSQFGTGLLRLESNGRLLTLTGRDGLPGDRARCLTQDREGNLWVGMDRGGLVRLREKWFRVLGTPEGLSDSVALGVCEDRDGVIWTGTYGGGLNEWSKGKFTFHDFGVDGTKGYVFTVFPDDQDRLWIGTRDNGVFVRDGSEFRRPFGSNAICDATRAIYEDRNHAMWFGTSAGAYRWQSNKLEHFAEGTDLAQADVRALAEDRDGSLWIGTHGDGLHRFRNGIHTAFHAKDGLPNEFVRSLLADSDGTLWIGFYGGGIFRWMGDRLAQAAPTSDLPDDVICHFEDDGAGRLWISTHHGLFRVAKSDLHAFADGRQKHITCITYGKFDGLPTVEFSGGIQPSGWRGRDGRLWFTTGKGLVSLQPASITINPRPPPIVVESLLVDGEIFAASAQGGGAAKDFSGPLKVPAGRTRFEFRFTGLSFTAPDKVRFQYQLKGLEDDWMDAGMNRSVAYNYLAPGDYEFRVKAANNDGVWNETGASVSFAVLPHVWQRGWFRALLLALIVGLVWLAYYVRIRRLHELERLRLRIARDLHDDVGANLASMALIAEAMEKQPSFGSPAELRRLALQTVDSLRDIVWFIDPARDSLGDLVTRMRDTAAALLTGTRFDFHAAVPNPAVHLPPSFRRNVLPIFKEALHNAARHGRAGHVDIALDCANGLLRLTVKDDGKGFDEHNVTPGNGLRNLHRRAADMNGAVEIASAPGEGTTVKLEARFPQMRGFYFGSQRVYSKSLAGSNKNSTGQNGGAKQ
jgi:streptogramin lyase